jgi:hypothetical protein
MKTLRRVVVTIGCVVLFVAAALGIWHLAAAPNPIVFPAEDPVAQIVAPRGVFSFMDDVSIDGIVNADWMTLNDVLGRGKVLVLIGWVTGACPASS